MNDLISVVIPTLNGGQLFYHCIEAVARQKVDRPFEIIVVDSGSEDGTVEVARHYAEVIRIDKSEFNHGLTRNLGISKSKGKLIALLVQDAVPQNEYWLQKLVDVFADRKVAGAYSRQVPHPGANPIVVARLKRWSAGADKPKVKQITNLESFENSNPLEKLEIVSFDNVASMIRRSLWKIMQFPEAAFGEDTQWALEVLRDGWKIVYEPRSVVMHSHSKSLWYEFKRVYLDHQNWNQLVGLKLFPMPREIVRAGFNGVFERWGEIDEIPMSIQERVYWKAWAVPYSFSQNLAQFLGAISPKWKEKWPAFKVFDRLMKRGV
jgi:rhamnosyltransferase